MKRISIIVPVRNMEDKIGLCIESLLEVDYPKEFLEIIVVDNNSKDSTKSVILRYDVKYVLEPKIGRSFARNKGIEEASGDFIVFIDADCVAKKDWLSNLIKGFDREKTAVCGGPAVYSYEKNIYDRFYEKSEGGFHINGKFSSPSSIPWVATFNSAFRADVLRSFGGFDTKLLTCEDVDICLKIFMSGYEIKNVPNAVVTRSHDSSLLGFIKSYFLIGYSKEILKKRYARIKSIYKEEKTFDPKRIENFLAALKHLAMLLGKLRFLLSCSIGKIDIQAIESFTRKGILIAENGEKFILNLMNDTAYSVNDVGENIWKMAEEDLSVDEMAKKVSKEFSIDFDNAQKDILAFRESLKAEKLIA